MSPITGTLILLVVCGGLLWLLLRAVAKGGEQVKQVETLKQEVEHAQEAVEIVEQHVKAEANKPTSRAESLNRLRASNHREK